MVSIPLHSVPLSAGRPGVLHGNRTCLMEYDDGQITETHSISTGLDCPGVGSEHAWLKNTGRSRYVAVDDREVLDAFHRLCQTEGVIPALKSSHAIAQATGMAPSMRFDQILLVYLSVRGAKDIQTVAAAAEITL